MGLESSPDRRLEHLVDVLAELGRALDESGRPVLQAYLEPRVVANWVLSRGPRVALEPNQDERDTRAVVLDFGDPLVERILQTDRHINAVAHEKNVCFWVAQGSEPIVLLLASSVPKGQLYYFVVSFDMLHVVFKHCRDVNLWKVSFHISQEQRRLTRATIPDAD